MPIMKKLFCIKICFSLKISTFQMIFPANNFFRQPISRNYDTIKPSFEIFNSQKDLKYHCMKWHCHDNFRLSINKQNIWGMTQWSRVQHEVRLPVKKQNWIRCATSLTFTYRVGCAIRLHIQDLSPFISFQFILKGKFYLFQNILKVFFKV